jgi:hypothetical protein
LLGPVNVDVSYSRGRCKVGCGSFASFPTYPPHSGWTIISDMVRVAAITEADLAPMPNPAPKRSPEIIARARSAVIHCGSDASVSY